MALIFTLVISILLMGMAWFIYQNYDNPVIVDVIRPINVVIVSTCYLFFEGWDQKSSFAFYLVCFWGLRLSLFVFITRFLATEQNRRYEYLSQDWQDKEHKFLMYFMQQGFYVWVISLPFFFIAKDATYSWLDQILLNFSLLMILMTTLADWQLYRHRKKSEGQICQHGLWGMVRHPNYLFEWLTWLGFSLLGIYSFSSIMSLFSALLLYFILRYNRIKITEEHLLAVNNAQYKAYQSRVPTFFPWT